MAEQEKTEMTAPPVIRRTRGGLLELVVGGHPVDCVMEITSVCNREGSYTNILIHNSYVIFEVEKPGTSELDA